MILVAVVAGIGLWSARRDMRKLPPSVTVALRRQGMPPSGEAAPGRTDTGDLMPLSVHATGYVVGVEGPLKGQRAAVRRTLRVGRDRGCALRFAPDRAEVSRTHCALLFNAVEGCFYIEDLVSTNGTFLAGGDRLEPGRVTRLNPGDEFCVGTAGNRFRVEIGE